MPSRLDRSYLSNLPWSTQNHFLAACRSLGLIEADGKPNPLLIKLVETPDARPQLIGDLLRRYYPGPIGLSQNATQAQLEEAFKAYGQSGSTSRKSIAFFLHAATFAQLPLSPHFRSPRTTDRAPARRRTKASQPSATTGTPNENDATAPASRGTNGLHPFLEGLLRELPENGARWTQTKRENWLKMAELTVDMLYKVNDE